MQNWHLYLRSGARVAFREDGVEAAGGGRTATLAPGILTAESRVLVFDVDGDGDGGLTTLTLTRRWRLSRLVRTLRWLNIVLWVWFANSLALALDS